MKRVLMILAISLPLAACATIDGVGQDISSTANVVRDAF